MNNVKFYFSADDSEMKNDLEKTFGNDLVFSEERDFIGDTIFVYIIPATALAFQILDFVLTHVVDLKKVKNKGKNAKSDVREKRRVEIDGQTITLINYSAEEIRTILSSLGVEE